VITLGSTPVRSSGLLVLCVVLAAQIAPGQSTDSSQAVSFSGFVDANYSWNFASPDSRTNKLRNFDIPEHQVNLSLAELVIQKKAQPIGFRADIDFGTANDVVQGIAPYGTTPYNTLTNIQQAYLTGVIPVGKGLTADAGKFVTHMGYEVIESKDNWNYSRSLLFAWAVPYYHTGFRLTYPFADNFTAAVHIVNGWNSVIDNNKEQSLGLTLSYSPGGSTTLILNVMDGFEQPEGVDAGKKKVFDLIVTQQLTEAFALSLNADYGDERLPAGLYTWKGAALYGRYVLSGGSAFALRAEIFDDPGGYATGLGVADLVVNEVTATYEYKFAEALLVRGEARYDFANSPIFDKGANVNTEKSQMTLLVGIVAMF